MFFGTPQFAVPTLERILEAGHRVVAVVCQPDKPAGRGHKLSAPPTKKLALELGIPVLQPTSVRKEPFPTELEALKADVSVVVAYGKILPRRVLDAPKHGSLNVHGSLLPAYRGAAPIQWAVVNGEEKTGITIMQMDEGMDTGPMIAMREVEILDDDDSVALANMMSLVGADLMVETLARLERDGKLDATPQDHTKATNAPLIERGMARIDWSLPFYKILCAIRGFQPWPKAFTTLAGKEVKIITAESVSPGWLPETAWDERVKPGMVVDVFKGRGFVVRTGGDQGAILVTRVQPADKPEMPANDLINGGMVDVGSVFGT